MEFGYVMDAYVYAYPAVYFKLDKFTRRDTRRYNREIRKIEKDNIKWLKRRSKHVTGNFYYYKKLVWLTCRNDCRGTR